MLIQYRNPHDGQMKSYNPETEGYFITVFKVGTKRSDLYIPPLPSNTFLQLGNGWVGKPCPTLDLSMRELCAIHVRFPHNAHLVEICKCPFAFAPRETFVPITDQPDPRILAMAKTIDWDWWMAREGFYRAEGKYA